MNSKIKTNLNHFNIKDDYSPYTTINEIPYGKQVLINNPKYSVELNCYDLIPGISIVREKTSPTEDYSNRRDYLKYEYDGNTLIINYMVYGRCQLKIGEDKYVFIQSDDINIHIKQSDNIYRDYFEDIEFFHILINKEEFKKEIVLYNREYGEIIDNLFKKASTEQIVFKSSEEIKNIIHPIINDKDIPENLKRVYIQVKVLEFLIKLSQLDLKNEKIEQHTFSDAQIRVVRKIKKDLSRNIAQYISLEVLSSSYGINLTTLKNCFRDMYNKPLYTWYREYKFNRAKDLIKNTDFPISKIANMIGYKSSSKFAKAFKKEIGALPSEYRKNKKEN